MATPSREELAYEVLPGQEFPPYQAGERFMAQILTAEEGERAIKAGVLREIDSAGEPTGKHTAHAKPEASPS